LSLSDVENMTLLEIEDRLEFIRELRQEKNQHFLKDLSCLIFYGTAYGVASTKTKKPLERDFHKAIDNLLQLTKGPLENPQENIEAELNKVFG
jgi:hypothetical protein